MTERKPLSGEEAFKLAGLIGGVLIEDSRARKAQFKDTRKIHEEKSQGYQRAFCRKFRELDGDEYDLSDFVRFKRQYQN